LRAFFLACYAYSNIVSTIARVICAQLGKIQGWYNNARIFLDETIDVNFVSDVLPFARARCVRKFLSAIPPGFTASVFFPETRAPKLPRLKGETF
jgi:hypothetical protein